MMMDVVLQGCIGDHGEVFSHNSLEECLRRLWDNDGEVKCS